MKKHKRIIKGVAFLFVVMLVVFLGVNVDAAEPKWKTTCPDGKAMDAHYGIEVKYNGLSSFTISVKNGTFKIASMRGDTDYIKGDPTKMGTITKNKPLTIEYSNVPSNDKKVFFHFVLAESDNRCMSAEDYEKAGGDKQNVGKERATYGRDNYEVNLPNANSTQGTLVENENIDGVCKVLMQGVDYEKYKSILPGITAEDVANYNYQAVDKTGKGHYDTTVGYCQQQKVQYNYTKDQTASMIVSAISSWEKLYLANMPGDPLPDDFESAFNYAKGQALAISGHHFENPFKKASNISKGITVDPLRCDWKKEATGSTADKYYVNKDYYYASQKDVITADYTYHYTGIKEKTASNAVCERTCEESVVAEYGPPVASKAGLCFEYKIRVTSRVKCKSDIKAQPPTPPKVCTPIPICNEVPGYVHQGGPKEEFDACINKCDGGKYTQSCSNKCYKEVYGKESSTKLALSYGNLTAKKVANNGLCSGGKYAKNNGTITWEGAGYGRWYCEQNYVMQEDGYKLDSGFKRAYSCNDPCHWVGCEGDTYLNKKEATDDQVRNLGKYNEAIAICRAAASCSTRTAEFEIDVTYKHKEGKEIKKTKINFPYTSNNADNKSTLPSLGNDGDTNNTDKLPTSPEIFIPDTNPKGYAGCYEKTSAKNWYQAEWSFPGTWIHNKTGDISYVDKSKENAWHYKKNKFCVPLNALSVNTKWWEWSQVKKDCLTESKITDDIDYNIEAQTKNFGYFGWNITFSCFYALKNEICDTSVNGCCNPDPDGSGGGTTIGPKNFTFRIVDTMDLFPAANGSSIDTSRDKTTTVTGRKPGFNWTLDATNIKNEQYKVEPLALIGKVQDRKGIIYDSNEYLDYSFILTKEKLNEIRQYNKGKQYNAYNDGDTEVKNGITVYTSKLITKYVDGNHRGNIGCNNDGIGSACE